MRTPSTAAGTPGLRSWRAATARALPRGQGAALRRHWLAAALLLAGLVLRLLTQFAYRPALLYIDTVKYLYNAWPGTDPVGYKVPLKFILLFGDLSTVAAIQHLLGLAMAAVLYLVLLRRGCRRWLAAVAIAPVLLDAYQLQMEQMIMPDVWFEALIVAGLAVLLWRPRPGLRAVLAAGLILGASATLRQVGEILLLPATAFVVIVTGGWRVRAAHAATLCAAFALPILAYSGISLAQNGHFQLSHSGTSGLYGRMAADADCATLKLAADERALCPTPSQRALGPDGLEHSSASPLKYFTAPPGLERSKAIADFNHQVLRQQPLRIIGGISRDAAKLFTLTRFTSPGDTPISRWQFQDSYPTFGATIRVNRQHVLVLGVQLTASGGINNLRPLPAPTGGKAAVSEPLARFLRGYQLDGGFTPGPLLAIAALAGLIGSASLARRRRPAADPAGAANPGTANPGPASPATSAASPASPAASPATVAGSAAAGAPAAGAPAADGRPTALACFLFWTTAVAVLIVSDLFEFSWRYQLPALITLPPAGALGITIILSGIRRRRQNQPRRRNSTNSPAAAASSEPMPNARKAGRPPSLTTSQPKFWPKNPVRKVSGRKTVAMTVSCFITSLSRFDTIDR
jgi:hypothetical protein